MGPWHEGPLVGLDFETTGVDPHSDVPVQVAVMWSGPGPARREVFLVDPGCEIPQGAVAVHGITTERARAEGRSLEEAARIVHRALLMAGSEAIPIVAMNASFDLTIAEALFQKAGLSTFSWDRVIDPLVIDRHVDRYRKGKRRLEALCEHYGIDLVGPHDAACDAEAAVALAREIGRRYEEAGALDAAELTVFQSGWHRAWALEYDSWCRTQGREGLEEGELCWPVRLRDPSGAPVQARESRTMSISPSLERGFTTAIRMAASPS